MDFILVKLEKYRTPFVLAGVYVLTHFLLLLSRGIYWDGWYLSTALLEKRFDLLYVFLEHFRQYPQYFLLKCIGLAADPIFTIKAISFFSWLVAGLALYFILRNTLRVPEARAFFVSASFLLIPLFLVKGDASVILYSVSTMLFFLGALLFFVAERKMHIVKKYGGYSLSLVCFSLSFTTNSYLAFYGGFLLLLLFRFRKRSPDKKFASVALRWAQNDIFFILLPIIFWVTKIFLGSPYGVEAGYNHFVFFDRGFFPLFIQNVWSGIAYGFFWPLVAPVAILERKIFAALFFLLVIILYGATQKIFFRKTNEEELFSPRQYLFSGLFLFALGLFPYLAVGKAPHIYGLGFGMRHALLLPLGSSLIILGTILIAVKERFQAFIQVLFLALFMTFSIFSYYELDMDWYKERVIIEGLRTTTSAEIRGATTLVFHDTPELNYGQRTIGSSDYRGYTYAAFGLSNFKFAVTATGEDVTGWNINIQREFAEFKALHATPLPDKFIPDRKTVDVGIVFSGVGDVGTVGNWLRLKRYELFSSDAVFLERLKDTLGIKVEPR